MFNDFEKQQKEKAFNYSKLRFENLDSFLNKKNEIFTDTYTDYSYFFIGIANFISFKEDIWIKNKRTKNIATNFSKEVLDDFIFNGKFKTTKIDFLEQNKQKNYTFSPIKINNILSEKEKDSAWIIDNIRDSIAHGHYYIDFDKLTMVINNTHEDRLLNCEIDQELFLSLTEIVTEERIGGYTDKKLTTTPILYMDLKANTPFIGSITNKNMLKDALKNKYYVCYCQVTNIKENDENKKYDDLVKFYNYNVKTIDALYKKCDLITNVDIGSHYVKKMCSYIEDQMQNYDVTLFHNHLDDDKINKILCYIDEQPDFYGKTITDQSIILHEIIKSVISHEKITIERGVTDILELYNHCSLKNITTDLKIIKEVEDLIYGNINSFRENKKLANLFILGTNNFVSNKESIYDKHFNDYEEFDLSNFNYQDYSAYDKLIKMLRIKSDELYNYNNTLTSLNNSKNKLIENLDKAPTEKKYIIQNNLNMIEESINTLNIKINDLIIEISNIEKSIDDYKTDSNGNYLNNNNKSFFNHLRNAFAHTNISYYDDRVIYNRKVLLEDYDDNHNLTFRCTCRYYDLVKLLNNELFLEAINDQKNIKTL